MLEKQQAGHGGRKKISQLKKNSGKEYQYAKW